jgi:hypothetical protein
VQVWGAIVALVANALIGSASQDWAYVGLGAGLVLLLVVGWKWHLEALRDIWIVPRGPVVDLMAIGQFQLVFDRAVSTWKLRETVL